MPKKRNNAHFRAIEKIAKNPHLIGIEDVILSATEVNLYNNRGRLLACPDVVLFDRKGNFYIIEYKSNGKEELRETAENQLYRAVDWFSRRGVTPITMIVHGSQYPELKNSKNKTRAK